MKTVLVVGPSVPKSLANRKDIHIRHEPCISLQKIPHEKISLPCMDGCIFTSKHACLFLAEETCITNSTCFCVGSETARVVQKTFPQNKICIAPYATQEGVVECIKEYAKKKTVTTLFWPKSQSARSYLVKALLPIRIVECTLYAPLPLVRTYSLEGVDEILFTCPSSVDAFFSCVDKKEYKHLTFATIGPITHKRLVSLLR
jgi:uroporphyrinogen-III synthase